MFNVKFNTGNAAFDYGEDRSEIIRILNNIQESIEYGRSEGSVIDINGNKIGSWKYTRE